MFRLRSRMAFFLSNEARNRTVGLCVELGWMVLMECENGHGATWRVRDLETRFPPGASLEAIAERLTCSRCGSRQGIIGLRSDASALREREIEAFNASGKYEG
jgi:hypothetical protein